MIANDPFATTYAELQEAKARIAELEAKLAAVEAWCDGACPLFDKPAAETACECNSLAARGEPGDLEIYCPKCGLIYRTADTAAETKVVKEQKCYSCGIEFELPWQVWDGIDTTKMKIVCDECLDRIITVNRGVKP